MGDIPGSKMCREEFASSWRQEELGVS